MNTNRMRSRSRSPHHRRDRIPSRPKDHGRDRGKDRRRDSERDRRHRSRSRSPQTSRRRHSRSRSPIRRRRSPTISPSRERSKSFETEQKAELRTVQNRPSISDADLVGKTDDEIEMMKLMGFSNFDTTKGKHVSGNTTSVVNIIHKRKYRQYMNRKGGFNRPLDFVA